MSEFITVTDDQGIRTITINRPEKRNALMQAMYAAMIEALDTGDNDPAIRCFVITGTGDYFTSGNDLADFADSQNSDDVSPAARFPSVLTETRKPIILAVNGPAVGVGTTMLLQCDLAYAADNATFKTPFVDLALVPEGASAMLMPAAIGKMAANELLLLCDSFDAPEAQRLGLVARLFPKEILMEEVMRRAKIIASKAPSAMRASKALLGHDKDAVLAFITRANQIFSERTASPEFQEAAAAFMMKRRPDYSKFS